MFDIFVYEQEGVKKVSSLDEIKNRLVWLDITNISKDEEKEVKSFFSLHPLTTEDLYNQNIRIKVEAFPEYLFCVFYGLRKKKSIAYHEVDFVLGKNFIITNHKEKNVFISEIKEDTTKLAALFKKGVEFIFHKIIDREVDDFFPVLEFFDERIENLEERIAVATNNHMMQEILLLKRQIVGVKRLALPQRDKLAMLAKVDHEFIAKKAVPYFRDVYDHMIKVSDALDNYREAVGGTFDAYMSAVSNNMNEVMKVLSIIATIALPLTVISGVYGTNFTILPGAGASFGFWVMIGSMVLLMVGMLSYFKKKGWL